MLLGVITQGSENHQDEVTLHLPVKTLQNHFRHKRGSLVKNKDCNRSTE